MQLSCFIPSFRGENHLNKLILSVRQKSTITIYKKSCSVGHEHFLLCMKQMLQDNYSTACTWHVINVFNPVYFNFSCGEGCTHIAGLLFALEGRLPEDELSDLPCTSKPCQWNQPRKRKKDPRPITDISFKRVRYEDTLKVKEKKTVKYDVDTISFRNSLCAKLGQSSRAAIFDIIPPEQDNLVEVESDLNISNFQEVETSEHIVYESDRFIDVGITVKSENISKSDFVSFFVNLQ